MNIFKRTLLILALTTQLAPIALAQTTANKPEDTASTKKVSKISTAASYVGAVGSSAVALVSCFWLARTMWAMKSKYARIYNDQKVRDAFHGDLSTLRGVARHQAFKENRSVLLYAGLAIGSGAVAYRCIKEILPKPAAKKQKQSDQK